MLLRMYLRWAERRGFDVELDEVTDGPGGRHLVGHVHRQGPLRLRAAAAEQGVHRLVRISPFNAQGKRQTAFAALERRRRSSRRPSAEIEIDDKDLRIDTYRRRAPAASTST